MADVADVQVDGVQPMPEDVSQRVTEAANGLPGNANAAMLQQLAADVEAHEGAKDIVREAGAITALVNLVDDESADLDVRAACVKVLFHASMASEQNPSVIEAEGGMAALARVMAEGSPFPSESKVDAVGTMFNVTSFTHDSPAPVADDAIVAHVVELLSSATVDADGKTWAAGTLQNLSGGHAAHRGIIGGTPNAVATMLALAQDPATTSDTRHIIVAALYNLTIADNTNQDIILSLGGIAALVWLLKAGLRAVSDGKEAEGAAAAGGGGDADGGAELAPENGVNVLCMAFAAGALQNLVYDREAKQQEAFEAGGLAALLALLALPVPAATGADGAAASFEEEEEIISFLEMRSHAAGALFNITGGQSEDIDNYVRTSGQLPAVVALLDSGDEETLTNAAGALFNVTCKLEDNKQAVGAAGAVPLLCAVVASPAVDAAAWACGALHNLATRAELADGIVEAGVLEQLVDYVDTSTDGRITAWSAGILGHVASSNLENAAQVVEARALGPLIALATSQDEEDGVSDIADMAGQAVRNIAAQDPRWRREVIDEGGGELVGATLWEVCCGC